VHQPIETSYQCKERYEQTIQHSGETTAPESIPQTEKDGGQSQDKSGAAGESRGHGLNLLAPPGKLFTGE
jgi:hypothetical protein